MSKNIVKALPELIDAELITPETADRIRNYYRDHNRPAPNRLFILFGILGALLTGLGIILIIAHNWDEFSRSTRTFSAFLPLVTGQLLCAFALIRKQHSIPWRESSTTFLFFSVGASIALVGQIYHLPGNLSSFLLTWMLLCIPLVYVMRSSMASLLYLTGITFYACETGYWTYPLSGSYTYWWLLLLALPYFYFLYKSKAESNFRLFHHWMIPLSLIIALGTMARETEELMLIAYFNLFGVFVLLGEARFFHTQRQIYNGYLITGTLGTVCLLLALSFGWFWDDLYQKNFVWTEVITTPEFLAALLLTGAACGLLYRQYKGRPLQDVNPLTWVFLLFIIIFLAGLLSPVLSQVMINLLVFVVGLVTIRQGARANHLGILNYGLLLITALIVCRFFDANLNFIIRGMLFISVGSGFFLANYWMLRKRKLTKPNKGI